MGDTEEFLSLAKSLILLSQDDIPSGSNDYNLKDKECHNMRIVKVK